MVALSSQFQSVQALMAEQRVDVDKLAEMAGLERKIVEAIAYERYTPSPEQRARISGALTYPYQRIVWGHRVLVDETVWPRL